MLKAHVSLLATQFRPQSLRYDTFFLQDCLARNFKYSLMQREWDVLAVPIVRWATIIRPARGTL